MVGKNNHIRTIKSNLKEHYKAYKAGTRWIYASLASLALGAGLLLGSSITSYADTTADNTQQPTATEANATSNVAANTQNAKTVTLKPSTNTNVSDNAANLKSNDNSASNTNEKNSAAADTNNQSAVQNTPTTVGRPANNTTADPAEQVNTADQNTVQNGQVVNGNSASSATSDAPKPVATTDQQVAKKTLVDPTQDQLDAAKASGTQAYTATHQPQEIDAVADDSDTAAPLTISANAVGYGTNAQSPLTLTLQVNANADDVYKINIPADTSVYTFDQAVPLASSMGTTVTDKNTDGSRTVTDTFTTNSTTTQEIRFNLSNNATYQPAGMADVGKTVDKTITYSVNGVAQAPITFTQRVQPTTKLSTVSLLYPDSQTVSKILPNQNYVFGVSVNEADGVQDDSSATARVNSADNYGGSEINIPVPTGFALDSNSTNQINGFTDGSTVTQPGGKGTNVIISVPEKAGNQALDNASEYKIVGAFDVAQTATDQTLTANGNVTFSQVINSDGAPLTDSADPWSVTILSANADATQGSKATVTSKGNSSIASDKLELGQDASDSPQYLNSFGFTFNSAAEANNAKVTINIPSGLDVTSITTPVQGISPSSYMPDTSSWGYTLTLADGTTETGTVNAGDAAKVTGNSAIRTAVFTPNKLAPGSYTNDLGKTNSFNAAGQLSTTYDNGTAVKNGDKLTSDITMAFDTNDGQTQMVSVPTTQTIVDDVALGQITLITRSSAPGNPSAGTLETRYNDGEGQTTNKIYEPTFYFVIPKATTVASINSLYWYTDPTINPATTDPTGESLTKVTGAKVSKFTADNGQTVVKIDYSGTGTTVDMSQTTGYWGAVTFANNSDALPGKYPYYVYIASPKTKLLNATKPNDSSFVENNPNAYLMNGEGESGTGDWTIETAKSFNNSSVAQGNQDIDAVKNGTSDVNGDGTLNFYDSIVNTLLDDGKDHKASVAINLPTEGVNGSQYTFKLNDSTSVDVPANYTTTNGDGTAINPVILYSTQLQPVTDTATAPDTTGYVNKDQITDWSAIRSMIVQIDGIKANTSTGRIKISGTTTGDFKQQAGKTGYLQTIFYGDNNEASVESNTSVKITGTSTVKTRYHYVDASGTDQYVDLNDLSKTLNDDVDTFTNDYPTQLSGFSLTDQALIPTGYSLVTDGSGKVTPTIVDGTNNGKAEFGKTAQYYYDGDYVQYELADNASLKVTYVDTDNNNATVGTPETLDGTVGETGTYTTKVPANYVLADGQSTTVPYTFKTDASDNLTIKLAHKLDYTTATSTRTINYFVNDSNYTGQVPETQTQKINWKVITDEATGKTVATPQGAYYEQTVPTIPGYTADPGSVAQQSYGAVTGLPQNENVTVHYTAGDQSAKVEYIDDNNGDAVVGTPTTISGKTSGTANWNTNDKPAGYHLAANQAATGTYQFTNATDQTVKIHLTHIVTYSKATTTRTINYFVNDSNYTGQIPETQTQKINWKVTTDEATGKTVATPQGAYYEQTVPKIPGYTADPGNVAQQSYGAVTGLPQNESITVHYTAGNQSAKVEYVDDNNGDTVVGTPTTISGKTFGTADWNTNDKPAGYHLAANQAATGTYQFTNATDQTVKIHLTHIVTYSKATTTRTINYFVNDPNYTGQIPETQTQKINWKVTTDEATGKTVATPQGAYYEQTVPKIPGYTADPGNVAQQSYGAVTSLPQNESITVHYTAGNQNTKVEYVDDDNNGAVVGAPTTISGVTNGTASWNTNNKPDNYSLATGQAANGTYTFSADNNVPVQIHLIHTLVYTTVTSTRTIHYVVDDPSYTGQVPAPTVQTVTWKVVTDEVTDQSVATPQGAYYEQTVPNLPGYIAKPSKVDQQAFGSVVAQDVPMYNEDVVVTYTAQPTGPKKGDDGSGNQPTGPTTGPTTVNETSTPGKVVTNTTTPGKGTTKTTNPGTAVNKTTTPGKGVKKSTNPGTAVNKPATPGKGVTKTTSLGATVPRTTANNGNGSQSPLGSGTNAGTAGTLTTSAAATQNGSVSEGQSNSSTVNQQKLPQTNEQSHSAIGLGILGLLTSMLGLVGLKRRKRDDE